MDSNTVHTFSLTNPVIVILDSNRIGCGVTRLVEQHAHGVIVACCYPSKKLSCKLQCDAASVGHGRWCWRL
jgi:hypothetical protein